MTLLHPDAVDDVDASAPVIEAEMAAAIVNRARAMVQRRIAQLAEDGNVAEAGRLRVTAAQPLFTLLRSIDDRTEAHVQAIIATWGPRVIDEAALWDALDPPASLRADG
jgi:hypothetical protein